MRKLIVAMLLLAACSSNTATTASNNITFKQWLTKHQDNLEQLGQDVSDIQDAAEQESVSLIKDYCDTFKYDLVEAKSELPAPDQKATELLSETYGIWINAANDCLTDKWTAFETMLFHGTSRMASFRSYLNDRTAG